MHRVAALGVALFALAAGPGQTAAAPARPLAAAASAAGWIPDDPGNGTLARGWEKLQWNYVGPESVQAPAAWANLIRDHRAGASGVVIAVLDTGVAYTDWEGFRKSPDFTGTHFVDPCDLVDGTILDGRCTDTHPLDRNGHGTWVASAIAESTDNGLGVTGLAYGATIMPIRVLDSQAQGTPTTIAEGIDYAVDHGAQVINLSLAFQPYVAVAQISPLITAIGYAYAHGVVVVAAAGNDDSDQLDYPAADPQVISVGATTADGCLADYSDTGRALDLVAPGGGDDAVLAESQCHPSRDLPDVYQMTFAQRAVATRFGLPGGWYGTSMAVPAVSAAAAMVIASGVSGAHPTPAQILARLEQTARPLGGLRAGQHSDAYGYGLVDLAAATAPATTSTTTPAATAPSLRP